MRSSCSTLIGLLGAALFIAACSTPAAPGPGSDAAPANPPAAAAATSPGGAAAPPAAAPRPLRKIKVDYASYSAVYAPHFVAAERGYYAEEGLEMEMVQAPGTTGIAAVLSGETQFTTSASSC